MTQDEQDITRRQWLIAVTRAVAGGGALAAIAALPAAGGTTARAKPIPVVVYKDPECGCCVAWVAHLQANGFAPDSRDRTDMDALKDSLGVPAALRSCHTAVAGRYVIEGHVPAADIKRLLAQSPKQVAGLAVPGMPSGSPGMESPGRRADRYDVIAYGADGSKQRFAKH